MEDTDLEVSLMTKIKSYIFMKLGQNIWPYMLVHTDYWKRPYGVTFTDKQDFPKLFKYDMADMNDDLEIEMKKNG